VNYLEGVYWDLDGTIANTELEAHLPAFNHAFNDLGIHWDWDTNTYIKPDPKLPTVKNVTMIDIAIPAIPK